MTCLEIHRHVLKIDEKQLNVKSQGSLKRSRRPWLLHHADVFHLRRLCSPTFWTPLLHLWSRLSASFSSPFHLEHWHPTNPSFLCHCVSQDGGEGLSLPPAPTITRNLLSIVPFDFFHMCHVLTSISFTFHSQTIKFALCSSSCFSSGFTLAHENFVHLWSFCFPHSGHPCVDHHYQPSSHFLTIFTIFTMHTWSHLSSQSCLNSWTFHPQMSFTKVTSIIWSSLD